MSSPLDGTTPDPVVGTIESRRSTRRFDPERPLDPALLARLLALAGLAPSPLNLQPWRFVVVREPRNRKRLRACAFGDLRIGDAPVVLIVLAYIHPDRTDVDEAIGRMLALGAIEPEAVARFRATATREWERGDGPSFRATRSAMLASGTLMIAAEALGVASSWVEGFDPEMVREGFGVPDDHVLCGLLALGFAAEPAPFPGRFGLEHSCFEEHFGRPWPPEGPTE